MINTNELNVGYGKKIIVSDISLNVKAGQIVTLIGPNGSGKSTILKTVIGQLKSMGGSISVCSKNVEKTSEKEMAEHLSIVMTERIKSEMMTCREVVSSGRYPYTGALGILSDEDWKKVDEAIEIVDATEISDSLFENISDGQRQRIMLARAICQDTEIIALDEPTSFLDMHYKLEILKIIHSLSRSANKAILMSLHELDLARAVSDLVVCIDGDRPVVMGTPEEIYQGDYIQKLFGVRDDEFDPSTGHMKLRLEQ